jgi:hypothetical protein
MDMWYCLQDGVKGWEGVDWIHLAQDTNQWQAFMDTVMKLQAP